MGPKERPDGHRLPAKRELVYRLDSANCIAIMVIAEVAEIWGIFKRTRAGSRHGVRR